MLHEVLTFGDNVVNFWSSGSAFPSTNNSKGELSQRDSLVDPCLSPFFFKQHATLVKMLVEFEDKQEASAMMRKRILDSLLDMAAIDVWLCYVATANDSEPVYHCSAAE